MSNKNSQQSRRKGSRANGKMTWAQSVRDMTIASINKGQLPLFGLLFIVSIMILKMPSEDVSDLVFSIFSALKAGEYVAYILLVLSLSGWYAHAKFMRKAFSAEAERIGNEKSNLQGRIAGVKFGSSDKK